MLKKPLRRSEMKNEILRAREEKIARVTQKYDCRANLTDSRGADEYYMRAAIELAQLAACEGDVPVGCVIVDSRGSIIAADYNGREALSDALYHAESASIKKASEALGGWRLIGCTLYVTLEPCPMCAGACWAARVPRVVFGAKDARAGAMGSLLSLNSYPLNHKPEVCGGVLERECREILRNFFAVRRSDKTKNGGERD